MDVCKLRIEGGCVQAKNRGGSETRTVEVDGVEYQVDYRPSFVEHETDDLRDKAVNDDKTSNKLVFNDLMAPVGTWNPDGKQMTINPKLIRPDGTSFSHEAAHSMGVIHHDPMHPYDKKGNKLSGGISSYAYYRTVQPEEAKITVADGVKVANTTSDNSVKVHIKGHTTEEWKKYDPPTIIK
jgi:hypothetical protein